MTDSGVVRDVVRFLGLSAVLLILGELWLVHSVIAQESPSDSAVALISSVGTLAGGVLGALGAILVSTRSGPTEPAPVNVVNEPENPVQVEAVETSPDKPKK